MVSKEPERKAFHWPNLRKFEPQNKEVEELINKPLKKIGVHDSIPVRNRLTEEWKIRKLFSYNRMARDNW